MFRILLIALLLAGCVQLPPSPQDLQAKRFDAVPGKAVIYVVRAPMDSPASSGLSLDDREQITTLEGTYYRWEVAPGTHRIAGVGPANESITLRTAAGNIYFVEHNVRGTLWSGMQSTSVRLMTDQEGRARVLQSQPL
jgi:hypothetical protein